jgi:probable phosphoglycerate mutase
MTEFRIAVLRHGATAWNLEKKLQGRTDIALRPETIAQYRQKRIPAEFDPWPWYASPLCRTRQTADALGLSPAEVLPDFIEMDWGQWEGQTVSQLRTDLGAAMQENEDRGWDFRPDGGESPRDVWRRVKRFIAQWSGDDFGVVTHKGVIRALYAAAAGWDMMGKMPDRLDWNAIHLFVWQSQPDWQGRLVVDRLNIALEGRDA